ncbi:MAG TPA: hypothetical protein PLZ57_07270 [Pseudobdellovibrionaceae bacterium]|mgnify:CR=1 FL=1|nr:hypothetical protein [Pseudobdellovibrionaceae bacterium]
MPNAPSTKLKLLTCTLASLLIFSGEALADQIDPDRFDIEVLQDIDTGASNLTNGIQRVSVELLAATIPEHGRSSCYFTTQLPPRSRLVIARGPLRAARAIHAIFELHRFKADGTLGPSIGRLECWKGRHGLVEGDARLVVERINLSTLNTHLRARLI